MRWFSTKHSGATPIHSAPAPDPSYSPDSQQPATDASARTQASTHFRWAILGFFFSLMVINFAARETLPLASKPIIADYHLDPVQWGAILSSFYWLFSLMGVIGGGAGDVFGPKRIFGVASFIWAVVQLLILAASGYGFILFLRVLLGAAEGPTWSNVMKGIKAWLPEREQDIGVGVVAAGVSLGPAIAAPILTPVIVTFGWQYSFVLMGLVALIWSALWWIFGTSGPEHSRNVDTRERELIVTSRHGDEGAASDTGGSSRGQIPWRQLRQLLNRSYCASVWGYWAFNYLLFLIATWLPTYYEKDRGLSPGAMSIAFSVSWVCAFAGGIVGGYVSNAVYRMTGSRRTARGHLTGASFVIVGLTFAFSAEVSSVVLAVTLISVAMFFNAMVNVGVSASIMDSTPLSLQGSMQGLANGIATTPGVIAPIITGVIVQTTGSYAVAFALGGAISLSAAVASFVFIRPGKTAAQITSGRQTRTADDSQ